MLATLGRLLFFLGIIALIAVVIVFSTWNSHQLVEIRTPFGSDRYWLAMLLPMLVAAGALLSFFVMSVINISQGLRMGRTERDLRDQLKEKERQIDDTNNRLAEYDAQTREFTLQVMQITHAMGAPLKAPPGLALPPHDSSARAGDES